MIVTGPFDLRLGVLIQNWPSRFVLGLNLVGFYFQQSDSWGTRVFSQWWIIACSYVPRIAFSEV